MPKNSSKDIFWNTLYQKNNNYEINTIMYFISFSYTNSKFNQEYCASLHINSKLNIIFNYLIVYSFILRSRLICRFKRYN